MNADERTFRSPKECLEAIIETDDLDYAQIVAAAGLHMIECGSDHHITISFEEVVE